MDILSYRGSLVPTFADRSSLLTVDAVERLAADPPLPHPQHRVPVLFWDIIGILESILVGLDRLNDPAADRSVLKEGVFKNVELLMHRCVALNEYLGDVLKRLLKEDGKKGRSWGAAKDRLDTHVKRFYSLPINAIKHGSFHLAWIEARQGISTTRGYTVMGLIESGVVGSSASKKKPAKGDKEGFSFALTLREAVSAVFCMSRIAEEALDHAGIFEKGVPTVTPANEARTERLARVLEGLNKLPLFGLPDEGGHRVDLFHVVDGALTARKMTLRAFAGTSRISTEFPEVQIGTAYKMPYWQPQSDPASSVSVHASKARALSDVPRS